MNEADTRANLIDPQLMAAGWGVVEGSKILREHSITAGRLQAGGRGKHLKADYVLVYKGIQLAAIEAKSDQLEVGEGVAQAKLYAQRLALDTAYSANGRSIYEMCMLTGAEAEVWKFASPDELWRKSYGLKNEWRDKFALIPFEDINKTKVPRFYQEIAVNRVLDGIGLERNRILLTLATGTGKTSIAFHIAWKLFQARWTLKRDGGRRPRILFLADRNILSDQAYGEFTKYAAFSEDALVRITPKEISKKGTVPTNGSVFFTIFQTFMSGSDSEGQPAPYFGAYAPDYFDLIIIDECHRGGANDEGNWRGILEYFAPAVQLGLTATPKRKDNVDTYKYFGEPVYSYSLKDGINDGFLTPFKVKRIQTTLDDYIYTSDDAVIEGEVEQGKRYTEPDFNKIIEIKEREAKRVQIYLNEANQAEKAIIFCATQDHAAAVRDLVNQYKKSKDPNYCVRVTANDGAIGEQFLKEFQDNEKTIPTILTTSQKLSTGVDARNIRNIVLMRPVNSMIEFKQIVGRGTRVFEGKEFFTIYDYVNAYQHFADPEWDGEPEEPIIGPTKPGGGPRPEGGDDTIEDPPRQQKLRIKLADGKEREIQHMISTSFWGADGKPISVQEFLQNLFGTLPSLFKTEDELRTIWGNPATRKVLLENLANVGFDKAQLKSLQSLIDADQSDLFDVLEYVFNGERQPMSRADRVAVAENHIFSLLGPKEREFIEFVLRKYIETGVEELDQDKLPILLTSKYQSISEAVIALGGDGGKVSELFVGFQKWLYAKVG